MENVSPTWIRLSELKHGKERIIFPSTFYRKIQPILTIFEDQCTTKFFLSIKEDQIYILKQKLDLLAGEVTEEFWSMEEVIGFIIKNPQLSYVFPKIAEQLLTQSPPILTGKKLGTSEFSQGLEMIKLI